MDRGQRIKDEIKRLEGLMKDLDRDWSRLRWSGALLPLVGIVFMLWGAVVAMMYFLTVGGFWATSLYLIHVRRREYEGEIAQLELDHKRVTAG